MLFRCARSLTDTALIMPHPAPRSLSSPSSTCTYATQSCSLSTPSALPHQPDPAHLSFPSSRCPLLVPSKSNTRQQCAEARLHVEWCCAAAQSLRRRYGVAERRRRGNPSELWLPIRWSPSSCRPGCPDACHAVRRSVRVRCPPCGRTSVQLVGWTSGVRASGVHASGVHAPGVHTTGVIRVSGRTRVRCPRPLQPRWIRNTSVRRDRPRLVHRVRRVAVVGERLGRRCPNRAWRAKDGRTLAVRGSHEGRRQTWRCFAGVQAAAPRSPPGRPGELVQGQVPVGWWGSRGGAGAPKSPQVRAGRVAGVLADHGLDREVVSTLGGRCAGGGPVSSGAGGPIRFSGEQTAAAARPRSVRSAVR
jgi:hypothetical protein